MSAEETGEATPGDWFLESDGIYNATRSYLIVPTGDSWQDRIDAAHIVALHNNFPALSQELKAAKEERENWQKLHSVLNESHDHMGRELFEISSRVIAAEERANRYQMQYEEECEVHGDHIEALEKCQARIGDLERERHPLDVRRIAELQAELDRVDRERAAALSDPEVTDE